MSGIVPAPKDNASGQLNAGVNASSTSFVLKSGEGAGFPQPINGTATSGGTSITLNDTGIGASGIVVGDLIYNLTEVYQSNTNYLFKLFAFLVLKFFS